MADDEFFFAEQNALLVRDAEEYYQQMYRAEVSSWNLRDRHMAATLDSLAGHLGHQLGHAKVVVWRLAVGSSFAHGGPCRRRRS